MQTMVTVTANDSCPEMLAAVRRGPFATPTEAERIEYLLSTKGRDAERPLTEHYSLEHVLSFQRRVHTLKKDFFKRDVKTPLGRTRDWFDRTEAQMRAALHAHILIWMKLRERTPGYKPLAPITRTVAGTEQRQRKLDDKKAPPLLHHQEDNLYHTAYVNRVSTEMARPNLGEKGDLGGFDVEKLRIVGLARCVPQ